MFCKKYAWSLIYTKNRQDWWEKAKYLTLMPSMNCHHILQDHRKNKRHLFYMLSSE